MSPECPFCGSREMEETSKFDLQYIDPEEVGHDYACLNCEGLFQIIYAPIAVKPIEAPEAPELEEIRKPMAKPTRRRKHG